MRYYSRYQTDSYTIKLPLFPENKMLPRNICRAWDEFGRQQIPFHVVYSDSSKVLRKPVYQLALYFRREFSYDFVQYSENPHEEHEKDRAFVWTDSHQVTIGAVCFRWRKWEKHPESYGLAWAWFHPYARNKGHLKSAWPLIRKWAGKQLAIEHPISQAMNGFLLSRGEEFDGETVFLKDKPHP